MSDRESDNVRLIRKSLLLASFDPSEHIGEKLGCISIDSYDIEKEFFILFEKLTEDVLSVAKVVDKDAVKLQNASTKMEVQLMQEVDAHSIRLNTIVDSVDSVKLEFDKSVEGTLRIGGRLTVAESEKLRIEKAMQLLHYIIFFQKTQSASCAAIKDMPAEQIKKLLPLGLCDQQWGTISRALHDLKSILTDTEVNTEEVSQAMQIVFAICQSIEYELLGQFDVALNRLMYNMNDKTLVKNARELAHWLHLYSGGRSIQQKYIFTVVQRRIPSDAFFTGGKNPSNNLSNPWEKIVDVLNIRSATARNPNNNNAKANDSDSSAGASLEGSEQGDDAENENPIDGGERDQQTKGNNDALFLSTQFSPPSGNTNTSSSLLLIDHLSGLFAMINNVCAEQFEIIRMVFPRNAVARVTRLLIQRIFNDPAFGIQAKIESILVPQPPRPQLPLADYLDALVTVREKLTALNLMLIEYCSHPAMKGGVEVGQRSIGNGRNEKKRSDVGQERSQSRLPDNGGDGGGVDVGEDSDELDEEEIEDNIRSDNEIRDFFDEQISHVLAEYAADYYDKELTHIQNQYVSYLRKAVDDLTSLNKVYAGTVLQPLPHLKAEKMKSIANIVNCVLNPKFVNGIVSITTDALLRMESIGRDDSKLPGKIKDLFIFQLDFLIQGVFIPCMQACTTFLLKIASAKPQNSSLPPMEYFAAVAALSFAVSKIKSHFEDLFVRTLNILPNAVAVCKENRKRAFKSLENSVRVSMYAWSLCTIVHIEKILYTLQSKYDYSPSSATLTGRSTPTKRFASSSCTIACDAVCKELLTVANTVHANEKAIQGLDLVKLFWRPFGQQFVGVVISHIRRQKVSEEGAEILIHDIHEYINLFAIMEVPETIDMLYCIKEICSIYSSKSDQVAKVIIEDLRHLDTAIVMALSHARGDSTARGTASHWTKVVSAQFPSFKADPTFPWEIKKHTTVVAFQQSFDSQRDNKIGPKTLRKSTAPLSARQLSEIARTHTLSNRNKVGLNSFGRSDGQTISLDIAQLQNFDENAPLDIAKLVSNMASNQHSGRSAAPTSTYLPSRPDDTNSFMPRSNGSGGSEVLKTISVNGMEISRPDLIGGVTAAKGSSDHRSINTSAANNFNSNSDRDRDKDQDREDHARRAAEQTRTSATVNDSRNAAVAEKSQKPSVSTFKMVTNLFSKRS